MTLSDRNQLISRLAECQDIARQKYNATLKGVFGSVARGTANDSSDIDILVEFGKGATLLDWTGLGSYLETRLYRTVDLVSTRALRKEIKNEILSEMVSL